MSVRANRERDECLERLWHRRELGIAGAADGPGDACIHALAAEGLVALSSDGRVSFSPEGERRAQQLVRSHRLAERLVQDVLGESAESSACEFEHLVGTEVVDAICTLLGHPRECPHGNPIPPGNCCERSAQVVSRQVMPLTDLEIGKSGRIAWVYTRSDAQLHALDSLQLRPGAMVTLHQRRPSYVVECEGASIALDDAMAAAINVWAADPPREGDEAGESGGEAPRRRGRHGRYAARRRGWGRAAG